MRELGDLALLKKIPINNNRIQGIEMENRYAFHDLINVHVLHVCTTLVSDHYIF